MVAENRGRRGGSKPKRPRVTQAQQWAAIHADDAAKVMPAHQRADIKRRLERERKNLRRDVPSEPWFDAKWYSGEQFPPGGDVTGMERCTCCQRYTPKIVLTARDVCPDCVYGSMSPMQLEMLPSSPGTVIDMARLNASRRRGENYLR